MAWWTSRSHDPDALSFLSFLSFELFTSFYIIYFTSAKNDDHDHQKSIITLSLSFFYCFFNSCFPSSCSIRWSVSFSLLRTTFDHVWRRSNLLRSFATLSVAQASSCKKTSFCDACIKRRKKNRLKMNQHDRSSSTEVPHENSRRQTFQDKRRTHFIDMPSYLVVSEATSGLTFSSVFKRLQFTVHTCTHSHELRWFGDARASERKPWPM